VSKAALSIASGLDVTPHNDIVEGQDDERALNEARKRRSRFSFDLVGLQIGTILQSSFDPTVTCTVAANNRVVFEGQETSLSAAALTMSQRHGYNWPTIPGPDYWIYEGKSFNRIAA
jgi:hypothetical protein